MATLERGLTDLGLGREMLPALETYLRLLLEKNKVMDLTAVTDWEEAVRIHLLDSLTLVPLLRGTSLVDVGTGGGLPGIPLAVARPDLAVTLLDSNGKRIAFLEEIIRRLELKNAVCVLARAEEFAATGREKFDMAVSRAVAAMPVLCELCLPLVRVGGRFLAMKSDRAEAEVRGAAKAMALLGGHLAAWERCTIPGSAIVHRAAVVEKVSPTPKKYPRRFNQIKKQPLL